MPQVESKVTLVQMESISAHTQGWVLSSMKILHDFPFTLNYTIPEDPDAQEQSSGWYKNGGCGRWGRGESSTLLYPNTCKQMYRMWPPGILPLVLHFRKCYK